MPTWRWPLWALFWTGALATLGAAIVIYNDPLSSLSFVAIVIGSVGVFLYPCFFLVYIGHVIHRARRLGLGGLSFDSRCRAASGPASCSSRLWALLHFLVVSVLGDLRRIHRSNRPSASVFPRDGIALCMQR
jgi:hypothetical protein